MMDKRPGKRLIWAGAILLAMLAAVCFFVSYAAQFLFVAQVKHVTAVAAAEALIPDFGMIVCALLALGMAVQGRSAKAARVCVVGFAVLSAVMNFEAADSSSVHAVTVYVMPPLSFAVVTDLLVATVRRFYYGVELDSPWAALGRVLKAVATGVVLILLYLLRLALDPRETFLGLREAVLRAAPLPSAEPPELAGATKKVRLAWHYARDPAYGDRAMVASAARRLAPVVGLGEGTARAYLGQILGANGTPQSAALAVREDSE